MAQDSDLFNSANNPDNLVGVLYKALERKEFPATEEIISSNPYLCRVATESLSTSVEHNSAMNEQKIAALNPDLAKKIATQVPENTAWPESILTAIEAANQIFAANMFKNPDRNIEKQPSASVSNPEANLSAQKEI